MKEELNQQSGEDGKFTREKSDVTVVLNKEDEAALRIASSFIGNKWPEIQTVIEAGSIFSNIAFLQSKEHTLIDF